MLIERQGAGGANGLDSRQSPDARERVTMQLQPLFGIGIRRRLTATFAVTNPSGLKPIGALVRFMKVRSIRPAATSGMIESATSAMTRLRCRRRMPER